MSKSFILSLLDDENLPSNKESIEHIKSYLQEYHYATKYLSKNCKVRAFVVYLLLFKKAYFEIGKRTIAVKLSELGENLLSDQGNSMSYEVIKRGVDDLIQKGYIRKTSGKPGEINEYEIKLPSEIREVREMIESYDTRNEILTNEDLCDYYTIPEKRVLILERDNYKCSYCMKELNRDEFYIDHVFPRSKGGHNFRSNLLTACKSCNTKKNDQNPEDFLLGNYRSGLLLQDEYLQQRDKIKELSKTYEEVKGDISHSKAKT